MNDSPLARAPEEAGRDRMPMVPVSEMTAEQRTVAERVSSGPRGGVIGPFVPLLRSPTAMEHLQQLGAYLRFGSPIPPEVFEMAVLLVARHRDQQFEWAYHLPLARVAGLAESTIEAIAHDQRPPELDEPAQVAYSLVTESLKRNHVVQRTFDDAVAAFGHQGAVDLVVTTGYYTTLAMVMNFARTPPPPGSSRLPRNGEAG